MKIGIITFWESTDNYGQVLQAYALQRVLRDMGHEPFQIKYSLNASQVIPKKGNIYKKILKAAFIYPLLKKINRRREQLLNEKYKKYIETKNKTRNFIDFRNRFIIQGDRVFNSIYELRANPPKADCYITGSDQVWTMMLNNESNSAYYLDFGSKGIKRISYAASFGRSSYPTSLQPYLKELLSKFDAISVREKEGVEICSNLGVIAKHVLDPTLLLNKCIYMSTFCNGIPNRDNYLYVYSINVRSPKNLYWNELKKIALLNDLSIKVTISSGNIPGREIYKGVNYNYSTIEEWISNIANAKLVATSSFHGVVFCLLMHTNFIFYPLKGKDTKSNGRVVSLLESVGLKEKICYSKNSVIKCIKFEPNWDKVDDILQREREKSLMFLKENLSH